MIKLFFTLFLLYFFAGILYSQNEVDYKYFDTLQIGNEILIYRIEADTISIDEAYGHTIISDIKILDNGNEKLIQEIKDTSDLGFSGGEIYLDDINLDNYNDIVLDLGAYNLNSTYYVWLYDKTKRLFSDYIVFQNNDGLIPDSIFTTTFQELGGRGGYSNIYKIIAGDFILIESRSSSNDGYSGSYQNTFYENEKMRVTVNGIYLWDNSENSNDTVVVRFYEDIFDSLLVEKTIWLFYHYDDSYNVRTDLYEKIMDDNFYDYIKKEEYNYFKKDGNILVDTTKYKYYRNNWIPIQ